MRYVTGEQLAQVDNADPFASPVWRSPVYRTPEGAIWLVQLVRSVRRLAWFLLRHPLVDLSAAFIFWLWRAVRTVMIPDIAMPAVLRLLDRGAAGREHSDGRLLRPPDQWRPGRLPRLRDLAEVPQPRARLHGRAAGRTSQVHGARAAPRVRVPAHRIWSDGHAGGTPDGTQQGRDDQEHLRAPVRTGPRVGLGSHERGGQPSLRLRGHRVRRRGHRRTGCLSSGPLSDADALGDWASSGVCCGRHRDRTRDTLSRRATRPQALALRTVGPALGPGNGH